MHRLLSRRLLDETPSKETWRRTSNGHGSKTDTTNRSIPLPIMSFQFSKRASRLRFRHHLRNGPDFRYGLISIAKFVFISLVYTTQTHSLTAVLYTSLNAQCCWHPIDCSWEVSICSVAPRCNLIRECVSCSRVSE